MPEPTLELLSTRLADALRDAYAARRGVPADLQPLVREHAKAWREAGRNIESLIVNAKELVRTCTGPDETVFIPRIIGWSIAGFFQGTTRE